MNINMKTAIAFVFATTSVVLAAPAAQYPGPGISMEQSINDMTQGAAKFPTMVLNGNQQGAAAALAQIFRGAASFPQGFFGDMAKGYSQGAPQGAPRGVPQGVPQGARPY
jgi:hypothetical protein